MAVKKVAQKKKANGVVYDLYPHTSADVVSYNNTTVAATLASLASDISTLQSTVNGLTAKPTSVYADNGSGGYLNDGSGSNIVLV